MKTKTFFQYSSVPSKGEKTKLLFEKLQSRNTDHNDFRNQRFAFITNEAIQQSSNWDASWFANYE